MIIMGVAFVLIGLVGLLGPGFFPPFFPDKRTRPKKQEVALGLTLAGSERLWPKKYDSAVMAIAALVHISAGVALIAYAIGA